MARWPFRFVILGQIVSSLKLEWGRSVVPRRSIHAPLGQDSVAFSRDRRRAVVVDGNDKHFKCGLGGRFARQLSHHLVVHKGGVKDSIVQALQTMAIDGVVGEATLAVANILGDDGGLKDSKRGPERETEAELFCLGDCEAAVLRKCRQRPTPKWDGHVSERFLAPHEAWKPIFSSRDVAKERAAAEARSRVPAAATISDKGIILHPSLERYGSASRVRLRAGDVVVLGSDGLFDNLCYAEVLASIVEAEDKWGPSAGWGRSKVGRIGRRLARRLSRAANGVSRHPGDISAVVGVVSA